MHKKKSKSKGYESICKGCGKFFINGTNGCKRLFCTKACRSDHLPDSRVERLCESCSKTFRTYPSQPFRFCSVFCKYEAGRLKETKCVTCGTLIKQWKSTPRTYCSVKCRRKKKTKTCKLCGKAFSYLESDRKKAQFCSIDCNNTYRSKQPGFRESISKGQKRFWSSMSDEQRKEALKSYKFGKKINKLEARLANVLPSRVEYTGDHSFWVIFKDGRAKNPDFVVRPFKKTKKVIEVFGGYWHTKEEAHQLVLDYEAVGVECLIVWEDAINNDGLATTKKVHAWL